MVVVPLFQRLYLEVKPLYFVCSSYPEGSELQDTPGEFVQPVNSLHVRI
jgi:hypothetical protein